MVWCRKVQYEYNGQDYSLNRRSNFQRSVTFFRWIWNKINAFQVDVNQPKCRGTTVLQLVNLIHLHVYFFKKYEHLCKLSACEPETYIWNVIVGTNSKLSDLLSFDTTYKRIKMKINLYNHNYCTYLFLCYRPPCSLFSTIDYYYLYCIHWSYIDTCRSAIELWGLLVWSGPCAIANETVCHWEYWLSMLNQMNEELQVSDS